MFLAEGREHLQELNLAVVRIEETPDDRETVDEIFRIAHSMKGMSATMGFAGMAALTHEMEDVFELLRQRRGGLERAAIDVLLQCLDALEASVDAIDTTGAELINPAPLIERLQGARPRRRAPKRPTPSRRRSSRPSDLGEMAQGRRVVQVPATLNEDVSDAVRPRLHGARRAGLAGRDARLRPRARRRRQLPGPRGRRLARLRPHRRRADGGRRGGSRRSPTRRPSRPSPDAAVDGEPEAAGRRDARRPPRGQLAAATAPRPSASTPSASTS